jgi:UrcA family protein
MNASHLFRRLATGTLAVGATLVTATLLQATIVSTASAAEAPTQRAISLRGLDLKRPTDVAVLYDRIREAAESVCGSDPVTGSHLRSDAQRRCVAASIDSAVAAIDKAELSAWHRQAKAGTIDMSKVGA